MHVFIYKCRYIRIYKCITCVCMHHACMYICNYVSTVQRNLLPHLTFLVTEALVFCKTPVQTYQAALRHSPEDCCFIPTFCITNMDHWY